ADAFDEAERATIETAARVQAEAGSADTWYLSAWGAKEALGKALGRGVLGGPRSIAVTAIDPAPGRITLELRGAMARAFPGFAPAPGRVTTFEAHTRVYAGNILVLCLLQRGD